MQKPKTNRRERSRHQFGALPFSIDEESRTLLVLLITSRETRRWVIPKGWPMPNRKPHETAAREALEEAGVVGTVGKRSIGQYWYDKRLPDGSSIPCEVRVFPLEVTRQRRRWPEMGQREAGWFSPEDAAEIVAEPDLAELIRAFASGQNAAA